MTYDRLRIVTDKGVLNDRIGVDDFATHKGLPENAYARAYAYAQRQANDWQNNYYKNGVTIRIEASSRRRSNEWVPAPQPQ